MADNVKSDRDRDELEDDEPVRLLDIVRAGSRRGNPLVWGPLGLALQIHRIVNKHLLLAQREIFEAEIKYVDQLIAADEEADQRSRSAAHNGRRKKVTVE